MIGFKEYMNEAVVPPMTYSSKDGEKVMDIVVSDKVVFTFSGNGYTVDKDDDIIPAVFQGREEEFTLEEWMEHFSKPSGKSFKVGSGRKFNASSGKYGKLSYEDYSGSVRFYIDCRDIKDIIKVINKAVKYAMKQSGKDIKDSKTLPGVKFEVTYIEGTKFSSNGRKATPLKRINAKTLGEEIAYDHKTKNFINSESSTIGIGNIVFLDADEKILKKIDDKQIGKTICNPKGCAYGETQIKITFKRV